MGRHFFYQLNRGGLEFARKMFSRAIDIDGTFDLAHAGLADTYCYMSVYTDPRAEYVHAALGASRKAVRLEHDPEKHRVGPTSRPSS